MKNLFILIFIITALLGCQFNLVDDKDVIIVVTPSATRISATGDAVNDSLTYDVESKSNVNVSLKRVKLEYFDSNMNPIKDIGYEQDDLASVYLVGASATTASTTDKLQTIKGIPFANTKVRNYMNNNGVSVVNMKVHFFFIVNGTKEVEKIPPMVEITKSDIVNQVAPNIKDISALDTNKDGKFDTIEISLDKEISSSTINGTRGFTIRDGNYVITLLSYSARVLKLTVINQSSLVDTYTTPKLQYSAVQGNIADSSGNKLASFTYDDFATNDKASPLLIKAVKDSNAKTITLDFSEAISSEATIADFDNTFDIPGTVTGKKFESGTLTYSNNNSRVVISGITQDITNYNSIKTVNDAYIKDLNKNQIITTAQGIVITK